MMKQWLMFLLTVVIYHIVHEGMHASIAMFYGEYEAFRIIPIGLEVQYKTPVGEREGIHWAFISGTSNLATIFIGYLLLLSGNRLARLHSWFLRTTSFYLTLICLLADPFNLSIGPLIYGGDANGIAVGLGLNRYIIQIVFLVILLVNRELIAQQLLPMYDVQVKHILFQPLMWARRTRD
jgi:hypothetical protein